MVPHNTPKFKNQNRIRKKEYGGATVRHLDFFSTQHVARATRLAWAVSSACCFLPHHCTAGCNYIASPPFRFASRGGGALLRESETDCSASVIGWVGGCNAAAETLSFSLQPFYASLALCKEDDVPLWTRGPCSIALALTFNPSERGVVFFMLRGRG